MVDVNQGNTRKFLERDKFGYYQSEYVIYGDKMYHPDEECLVSFSDRNRCGIWIPAEMQNYKRYRNFIYKTENNVRFGTKYTHTRLHTQKKKRMTVSSLIK